MKSPAVCLLVSCFVASRGLKFLNVGAPRTGTQSVFKALEILGFNSYHSGYHPENKKVFCDYTFRNGSGALVKTVFDEYDAAMDEPIQLLFKDALKYNPKTKMILPLADPEHWYHNYLNLAKRIKASDEKKVSDALKDLSDAFKDIIQPLGASLLQHNALLRRRSESHEEDICDLAAYWGCDFKNPVQTAELKARCIDGFNQHIANVKAQVPADQLLMFNLTDGWKPLTDFIGVPEPAVPFPNQDLFAAEGPRIVSTLQTDKDDHLVSLMKSKGATR